MKVYDVMVQKGDQRQELLVGADSFGEAEQIAQMLGWDVIHISEQGKLITRESR